MKNSISSKNRILKGMVVLFVLLSFLTSCSKSSTYNTPSGGNTGGTKGGSTPGANEVWIQGMAFNPSPLNVTANTTVTWTNKDPITHTVTSDAGLFDSGYISSGGTYSYTFAAAGTFTYHCKIHTTMTGSVIAN
jgi:plastocyanin